MLNLLAGLVIGILVAAAWFWLGVVRQLRHEHALELAALQQQQDQQVRQARKSSVTTSRAVLRGKIAEQFAPMFPEFDYYPNDAKFLGDPVDFVVFNGYSDFRDGLCSADEIEVVLIDIKTGDARLTAGQQAVAEAVRQGRVRFETIRIALDDER